MTRIFLDTGGTFTDGILLSEDGTYTTAKVPTTPQNLTLCFTDAVTKLAESSGSSLSGLLAEAETLVYATTKGTNTLIQRTGPRLGLITTAGFEDIERRRRSRGKADGLSWEEVKHSNRIRKPEPLIPRSMVAGVVERIDSLGNVVIPLDEDSVREAVARLVDQGAEGFVVNLVWSPRNPVHERRIREIIQEEFPDASLGAVPILLAGELSATRGEYGRGETAIVSAYLHRDMSDFVQELEEELRRLAFQRPLLMVQNNGGVARTIKTPTIRLWNSGPVAGTTGARFIAESYDLENVALMDMGGTSCDVAVYHDGAWDYAFEPMADRFRLSLQIIDVKAIGAGGGSIAGYDTELGRLTVGPQSAEAVPGPAAYGLGGDRPTVTDADVVLGYISPERFLGGGKELFPDLAEQVVREQIAEPMGVSVADAALAIRRVVDGHMSTLLYRQISMRGFDPREFTLLAYGGAGPVHAVDVGRDLQVERIMVFPFSAEFCAFGAACSDVLHQYQSAERVGLYSFARQEYLEDLDELNSILEDLEAKARHDFSAEALDVSEIEFEYEYAMRFGRQLGDFLVKVPMRRFASQDDVRALCDLFVREYNEYFGAAAAYLEAGIEVKSITLWAKLPRPRPAFPPTRRGGEPEPVATRPVRFASTPDYVETAIFDEGALGGGAQVTGPAVIERPDTNIVLPPDVRYVKDERGNGTITWEREG